MQLERERKELQRIAHSPQGGTLLPEQASALERYIRQLERQMAKRDERIAVLSAAQGAAETAR